MLCDDGVEYVLKLPGAQGPRGLPNELLAQLLGRQMDCPLLDFALIELTDAFLSVSPRLRQRCPGHATGFGTRRLPEAMDLVEVKNRGFQVARLKIDNLQDYPKVIAFDNWVLNSDRANDGNHLLSRVPNTPDHWRYFMSDHGHILKGPDWTLEKLNQIKSEMGLQPVPEFLISEIRGPDPFGPSVARIEAIPPSEIAACIEVVSGAWTINDPDREALNGLLVLRKSAVREILEGARRVFTNQAQL